MVDIQPRASIVIQTRGIEIGNRCSALPIFTEAVVPANVDDRESPYRHAYPR